jgi:hypothetical protein
LLRVCSDAPVPAGRTRHSRHFASRGCSPPAEDLSGTSARQQQGEFPADIDPAVLRLVLLAAVAAPVVFPDQARKLFGTAPDDPEFEARYASGLRRLIAHLTPEGRQ